MSLSLPSGSANAALAAKKEPQRKPPPRRSPRLAGLDRHPLAVPPTATASPTAASSNKRSIEDVHVNGSSAGGGGGSDHGGDPAAIPEAKAYSVTRSGKRSRQRDNGSVGQQVAAAATAAGAKSSTTRSSKRKSHGPDEESKSDSCQHQVITNAAATALGFHAATTGGFKKTSAATSSSINDESDKDSSGQPVVVAARPVVKTLTARTPSAKTSPDVDEESNTGSCNQEVLPSGGANASVAASFRERSESVAAPAVASASATSSGERRSSPRIDMGNDQEQIVAAAPAELAPTTSSGVRSSSQDSREKDNNKGEEVLEAAEEQALATSSRKRSIPDATKRPSNSTVTTDTTTVSPHMAILRQVQADLCEALYRCEELLGNMEEDLLRRQPNAMSVASVAQGPAEPVPSPSPSPPPSTPSSSLGALGPSRGIELHLKEARPVREVEPRERIFSQSSRTSVFWRSPVSRRQRTGEYRHGVDSPPVGCYASDGMITRAQQQQQRRGGGEGQQVVGYDAYRNRWVPLSRRELEQLAAEQALARGLCGSDDAATSDAAPGFYPSKG